MQHMFRSKALVESGLFSLFLAVGACGGGTRGGEDGDVDGYPDAGPGSDGAPADATFPGSDGSAGECSEDSCAAGQRCETGDEGARCTGSCEGVACATGLTCEVHENVGRCVVACAPTCTVGQRCEADGAGASSCVDNSCDYLACGASEACRPAPQGGGNVCVDNTCSGDLGCAESESCSAEGICVGDECVPGARTCAGATVRECAPNGAGTIERVACASGPHVVSACVDGDEAAACSCRDDWDCPAYTECVQGSCAGTGRAPTCFLPPLPFADLLPRAEPGFPWGGDDSDGYSGVTSTGIPSGDAVYAGNPFVAGGAPSSRDAVGHPFPHHAQVSTTPVVANLTDDNGDGRIDELDTPEIVFTAFCDRNYFNHGVLRALHGGGERAGQELFAVCEDKLWQEGDALTDEQGAPLASASCTCNQGDLEPTGALAVGDLDGDGVPEIVLLGHAASVGTSDVVNHRLVLFRNTGELISSNEVGSITGANPAVALANVDGQGLAEIIVGRSVFMLEHDTDNRLVVARTFTGTASRGTNNSQGPISCVADLNGDGVLEVVAGGAAYRLPVAPAACPAGVDDGPDALAYCANQLVPLWNHSLEGFCAVADVLGALPEDGALETPPGPLSPLDGRPEVVLITSGRLRIFDGPTGVVRLSIVLDNMDGGPPNIDDFDGDGFPEIGTAYDTHYTMHDLQAPSAACPAWNAELDGLPNSSDPQNQSGGNVARAAPPLGCVTDSDCGDPQFVCARDATCVCLHNGWTSATQDASSRVTGSSVFDFNGDGAAEVVYNDECYFRIYDGATGRVYQRLDSQSPTRIEYPVVADVDSDGNAEVIFSGSNARSENCVHHDSQVFVNGLQVLGEPEDRWISARRIWNQHAYYITNVLENGRVPTQEVPSWLSYGERSYNTYRSNLPPTANVAPDLTVAEVQVSSPDVSCGEELSDSLRIVARVVNQGDLRVGALVPVRFSVAGASSPFVAVGDRTLGVALQPGAEAFVSFTYTVADGSELPTRVRVEVDPDSTERECNESNNVAELAVVTSEQKAELTVELEATNFACPARGVRVRVTNNSGHAVPDALVRLYAGNPASGGTRLNELRTGPIAPHSQSSWISTQADVGARNVSLHAFVDPDGEIEECDDGNNLDSVMVQCMVVLN